MANIPSDPLFSEQWHLQNNTPDLLDLNVVDVWDDYTGAGVEVAVIDDGVQRNHPDINNNYSIYKDWDFDDDDTNASGFDGDNHGTAVAGIIASEEGNGIGGVGVAYTSTIFGFRIDTSASYAEYLTQLTASVNNASGLQSQNGISRQADVVNISLGMLDSEIFTIDSHVKALGRAVDDAAIFGRNGLGTVLVKSAGNSRVPNIDTNAVSWNANPHTISVAAVDQDGFVSDYSTHGASVLVSAFGTPNEVVTTDRTGPQGYNKLGDYTTTFNGTSAAAPIDISKI